ncbi:MAG: class I SAM-dependent methyltransferase [Pseudomonadota bacterium]|nr:class I SAM-dependent methyltransferase [Pseudomonadota bacterium]
MASRAPLAVLLACPQCLSPLAGAGCLTCRTDYPDMAGIPWLMPEPRTALIEWRGRLHHLLTHYTSEASRQRSALAEQPRGAATRQRLEHVAAALDDQAARIRELMQPLGIERRSEALAVHVALGTELPMTQGLSSYYTNLHRDWCWGAAENQAAAAAVTDSLPTGIRPERMLVLGAGACRLAYDLHQALAPALTVALDINPLFLFAAKRILSGDTLELYEFPIAPRTISDHAVLRSLAAPGLPTPGLELVLADAAAPPFLAGSFDLVLTPWFIDVAGEPVRRLLGRVNRVLRTGGFWINHGSLAFAESAPADAVSLEELLDSLPDSGFSRATPQESAEPYLASPASRHARRETVITFCARKERDVASPDQGRPVPEWLQRSDLPVPALPQIRAQALATRVHAFLLAMIDGERSIRDMARLMEQQQLMMAEDAEPAIRRFLARALAESTRPPAF